MMSIATSDARVTWCASAEEAIQVLDRDAVDVVLSDWVPEGPQVLRALGAMGSEVPTIVTTGHGTDATDEALRLGADAVLGKPFTAADLRRKLHDVGVWSTVAPRPDPLARLVGSSAAMCELKALIHRVATRGGRGSVLVLGESGVGKELIARAIHELGNGGPFVAVNCANLGPTADSQLFGHAPGAFTGANRRVLGAIQLVGLGTLCLDEVGDLPLDIQAKLLRALDGADCMALGDDRRTFALRARVVAMTNKNLEQEVAAGRFRLDLFHRLSTHTIPVPPLREHVEDLLELVAEFLQRQSSTKRMQAISGRATRASWRTW
jgi:DNA-binding NtrC family response regulator